MRHIVCAAFVFLTVFPGSAQERVVPESDALVVTGQRDVRRQARDFVEALTPTRVRGQIGRFEADACPAAIGLNPVQKAAVQERMRRVAEAAGAPLGGARCSPNAILVLVDDKRAFLAALSRERPEYFTGLAPRAVRRLVRSPGPVAAWQLTGVVDRRGDPIDLESRSPGALDPPSRVTAPVRPAFLAAALVIERRALEGLTTTQLADYAAMRLFARTQPERLAASTAPTILTIIEAPMGTAVPITLTEWDLAYLRGLYASHNNLYAAEHRSQISRRMANELGRREDESGRQPEQMPPQ